MHRGFLDFLAGVDDLGVDVAVEAGVDVSVAVLDSTVGSLGEVDRRVDGGSRESVVPDSSLSSATVAEGSSGCESLRRRAFESTVVSTLRKSTRLDTVWAGRMFNLIAMRVLVCALVSLLLIDSLLPSAIVTLMEMLSGESSLLEVVEVTELEREGMMVGVVDGEGGAMLDQGRLVGCETDSMWWLVTRGQAGCRWGKVDNGCRGR